MNSTEMQSVLTEIETALRGPTAWSKVPDAPGEGYIGRSLGGAAWRFVVVLSEGSRLGTASSGYQIVKLTEPLCQLGLELARRGT